jgi:TRAP-type mannitol/chloroaromatic compound transport system substrate-binding protein
MKTLTQNKKSILFLISILLINYSPQSFGQSNKTINWDMVVAKSNNQQYVDILNQSMIKYAHDFSKGQLIITPVLANNTTKEESIFSDLQNQKFHLAHFSSSHLFKTDPTLALFSSSAFGMVSTERNAWLYEGKGLDLMQKAYLKHNVYAFPGGNSGIQMGGWFKTQLKSTKDLAGMPIMAEGLAGKVFSQLGAEVITTPKSELLSALQTGSIHAVSGGSPSADSELNLGSVAKFYYAGWNEPSKERQFIIGKEAYDGLSADLKFALTSAIRLASYDTYIYMTYINSQKLQELQTQYPDVRINAFPRSVMKALRKKSSEETLSQRKADPEAKEIIQSIKSYQKQIRLWTRIGDQAYLNNSR